jgi:hypothetical protein
LYAAQYKDDTRVGVELILNDFSFRAGAVIKDDTSYTIENNVPNNTLINGQANTESGPQTSDSNRSQSNSEKSIYYSFGLGYIFEKWSVDLSVSETFYIENENQINLSFTRQVGK